MRHNQGNAHRSATEMLQVEYSSMNTSVDVEGLTAHVSGFLNPAASSYRWFSMGTTVYRGCIF